MFNITNATMHIGITEISSFEEQGTDSYLRTRTSNVQEIIFTQNQGI